MLVLLCVVGAKFKKYVGHSAHVTNVRFTHDQSHVISVGGADHAVFQWQFVAPGDEVGVAVGGVFESDSEASDSEMSDVASVDSDLEREQEKSYDRFASSCERHMTDHMIRNPGKSTARILQK